MVAAFGDDDGFGEAVLGAAAVGVDEELDESEAAFEGGGAVAEGSFDGVPEADVRVHERDDADLHEAFAGGAAVALPEKDAEVEDGDDDVRDDVDGFAEQRVRVLVFGLAGGVVHVEVGAGVGGGGGWGRAGCGRGVDLGFFAEELVELVDVCDVEGLALKVADAEVASDEEDGEERDCDAGEDAVDGDGDGAGPEAG